MRGVQHEIHAAADAGEASGPNNEWAPTSLFQQTHSIQYLLLPLGHILHGALHLGDRGAQLSQDLDLGPLRPLRGRRRAGRGRR